MDDIYLLTVFVAVGEELSFAAAARRLDLSSASVTRAIAHLEKKRGVAFLRREARKLRLTEVGSRYLDDARAILKLVKQAEDTAVGTNIVPRGHLRVTAPLAFGRLYIVPGIADYLQQYPEMEISAMFADRNVNLIDEGFDVAVRIGQLPDSGMKAVRVGQVRRCTYASPGYLDKHGAPSHPADLQHHRVIGTEMSAPGVIWKFGTRDAPVSVRLKPVLNVVSNDAAINAALLDIGIVQLPSYHAMDAVARGLLRPILQDYASAPLPIQLLHRESRFGSSKVRSFIDLVSARLRAEHQFE
ncbi:LysR family transcriptional regulator [Herbaspirillum robiniae]|uniref:LysR family transcriptional regulator n=1 Tax=Herbaspirillum robiniae TaxID=2014887 RepID=A0ABX2LYF6_9BURK|nr:LysR family transcriptional regulator [Herbaspirillum robiniae]NUU03156.1 LysR family transcriptional regulator [Herbaspirillum robiniae]